MRSAGRGLIDASKESKLIEPALSVIIPVYNESATVAALLDRVADSSYDPQIVVVDDGSTDGTVEAIRRWQERRGKAIDFLVHPKNRGKGAAIRTAIEAVRGRVTIIQDADLEYDPNDYPLLVEPILTGTVEVVYGSRYLLRGNYLPWTANRICVHLLNWMVLLLYGRWITDEATCYKAFRSDLLEEMKLECERFEFCPEATAKACRLGKRIVEAPIRYFPRYRSEGKKIRWWDGVEAVWTLLKWRVKPLMTARSASEGS